MGVARVVLVVVNILFLLLGLSFSILGFILRYGETLYKPYLEVGMSKLKTVLQDTNLNSFDVDSVEISEVLTSLAICLILGGLILSSIAFCGCCGACSKVKTLLWIYAIVILVFVVCEVVAVGILYGKPDIVKDKLKEPMKNYAGLGSSKVFSLGWNIVMIQFKCCGVDSYTDFDSTASSRWKTVTVGSVSYTLDTPIACCKTLPTTTTLDNCAVNPFDKSLSNYDKGCYDTVWGYSFGNSAIVIPVLVACGIVQVLFFISAIHIAKSEDKDKVSPF